MRAKFTAVALVAFGLLGAVAISAPAATPTQVADRGHEDHDAEGDDCVAQDEVLIGPVCVDVDDVISNILTT